VGSMAFHGTLLKIPQALDELPMVYVALLVAYCMHYRLAQPRTSHEDRKRMRRTAIAMTLYGVVFTVAYFTLEAYFYLFIASFGLVVTYLCLQGWRIAYRLARSPMVRRLFWVASLSFVGAVVVFWLPERFLPCDHPYQGIYPHAWWHLCGMIGTYTAVVVLLLDRLEAQGIATVLDRRQTVPFVWPR